MRALPVASGVGLFDDDEQRRSRVVVLAASLAEQLYGRASPLGSRLQISGTAFRVIGVLAAITGTFTTLLGSIAAVSLSVGGIGIMNIMLVSVRERTREIGMRMAVGARRKDILRQFLFEAVAVSLAGGAIGVGGGYGSAQRLASFGEWQTIVPSTPSSSPSGFSVFIGIAFGDGPARRAAKLDPVEALRFE